MKVEKLICLVVTFLHNWIIRNLENRINNFMKLSTLILLLYDRQSHHFLFFKTIYCILLHNIWGIGMLWEYFRKQPIAINEHLTSLKAHLDKPIRHHRKRKTIIASILILTLITLVYHRGFGPIKSFAKSYSVLGIGVGIYWNKDCTNTTNSLGWGFIDRNSCNNLTIFIQNQCNSPASIRLATLNWDSSQCFKLHIS